MTTPPAEVLAAMAENLGVDFSRYVHVTRVQCVLRALAAAEALGWRMVPVEATEEMEAAHFEAHARAETVFASVPEVWAAMLAAAPKVTP